MVTTNRYFQANNGSISSYSGTTGYNNKSQLNVICDPFLISVRPLPSTRAPGLVDNKRYSPLSAPSALYITSLTKQTSIFVPKRFSGRGPIRNIFNSVTRVNSPNSINSISSTAHLRNGADNPPGSRSYAAYSLNTPDLSPTDAKARTNNPVVNAKQHPGCVGKFCSGLCGNPTQLKAIGHGTHGQNPITETDKKTIKNVSPISFFGKSPKPQNVTFYDNPHTTAKTTDYPSGTQKINTDKAIQQVISDNEKP